MVEVLLHFLIPLTLLLIVGITVKKSIIIASFATLPDFDVFFNIHRSITHSMVFIAIVFGIFAIFFYYKYKPLYKYTIVAGLVTLTHPILDAFQTYTPLLYPLYNKSFRIVTELSVNMAELSNFNFLLDFTCEIQHIDEAFGTPSGEVPGMIFSGISISIILLLLTSLAIRSVGDNNEH